MNMENEESTEVRELLCEVSIDDTCWYTVVVARDDAFKDEVFALYVYYEEDGMEKGELVGGTPMYDAGNGLPTLIDSRSSAFSIFSVVVKELLSYVQLGNVPKHPLLQRMNTRDKIEKFRTEIEDLFLLVIE